MMMRNAFLLSLGLTVAACGANDRTDTMAESELPREMTSTSADMPLHVALAPTEGHTAMGTLVLAESSSGVSVTGNIAGLKPDSELAFSVYETGDCSEPAAGSLGETLQLGALPTVDVNDEGVADVDVTLNDATLTGLTDRNLRNRAIVVHESFDEASAQTAAAPIACGVITEHSAMTTPDPVDMPSDAGVPAP